MTIPREIVGRATRLVMFAMNPKLRPTDNLEYGALVKEYASNPELKATAEDIAREMRIQLRVEGSVLATHGVFAILMPDSPFIPTLSQFRPRMSPRERQAYGILFFVIAAYVYPSAEALADDLSVAGPAIHVDRVVAFATQTCQALQQANPTQPHVEEKYERAIEHLLSFRATGRSAGERLNLEAMIEWLCERYVEQGLFLAERRGPQPCYYARPHYRLQVRLMLREAATAAKAIYDLATQQH